MPEYYEIRIGAHLDPHWAEGFQGLQLTYPQEHETLLAGPLPDQAALHGVLERIRDLNLTLLSVARGSPSAQYCGEELSAAASGASQAAESGG